MEEDHVEEEEEEEDDDDTVMDVAVRMLKKKCGSAVHAPRSAFYGYILQFLLKCGILACCQ